jgi:hypothetical protein
VSETTETVDQQTTETQQDSVSPENKGLLHDLQAERAKRQSAQAELDTLKKANEEAVKQQLEDQNKFQELYEAEKLKTAELEPEVQKFREQTEAKKTALLAKLGDDADDFKGLDVPALEKVVEKLTQTSQPPDPGKPGQTQSGDFGGYKTKIELANAVAKGVPGAREAYNALGN